MPQNFLLTLFYGECVQVAFNVVLLAGNKSSGCFMCLKGGMLAWFLLLPVRFSHGMRFNVRIPVLLPAVAFPAHLALERFHTQVFIHVLLQILCLVEALITAVERGQNTGTTTRWLSKGFLYFQFCYYLHICKMCVWRSVCVWIGV